MEKHTYVAPTIEVLKVEHEGGVMSASAPGFGNGDAMTIHYPDVGIGYNRNPATGLEELINDILTTKE